MTVLIKRYANRKLYNTQTSRYITLKGIAELLDDDREVQVIDNETGEDITNVTLSQILVDTERAQRSARGSLLSDLIHKSGDALYGALRKGVDDASDSIDEIQRNVRKAIRATEDEAGKLGGRIASGKPDLDAIIQSTMERVLKALDLPRRSDIAALNENLEKVAEAIDRLDRAASPMRNAPSDSEDH